ncbi:glycosyltransferase family 4 protein [Thalassoglobus sp.]|uniref:glycosyltransferase family 4 protein n=1 Tax=Thalassoglobus sp. TaxID=2795869 RepID=UPI003AA8ABB0
MIRVGLTERHGMADEQASSPPDGVEFSFPKAVPKKFPIVQSTIKNFLMRFDSNDHDLIEAILSPIQTRNRWIYSADCFQATLNFNILGTPLPKPIRLAYMKHLFAQENFKKLIFWSNAAKKSMTDYGHVREKWLLEKTSVVYPAIRKIPDELIYSGNSNQLNFLFSGDFFRKGGANVIDSFEKAHKQYPEIRIRICCDEKTDFNTSNQKLKREYLKKIHNCPAITLGRVSRSEMLNEVLPSTDVYLLPTYTEAFGFAILEAMAFGITVIATNVFAIPEIVEENKTGFLIDISQYNTDKIFRAYIVNEIPANFHEDVNDQLYKYMIRSIESPLLRKQMGQAGLEVARSKFSFKNRNSKILKIYQDAIA